LLGEHVGLARFFVPQWVCEGLPDYVGIENWESFPGTVKVLAVTGRTREPELPDVQTAAEAGFPDIRGEAWIGLIAPRQTPAELVARLNREIAMILATRDVEQRLAVISFKPFVTTADEFRTLISEEHKYWGPVIRETGIKLD
jgi:tripartite-type tricarboxylate transporter receptor subunit TctC